MPQNSLDPELSGFIHNLRATLPYLEEFHQQTFVIQISGDLLEIHNSRVIEDLALLQQVGINIVLVHGAETQIRKLLNAEGHDYQTEDGIFVAEKIHLPLVEQAISSVNWHLLSRLRSCGRQLQTISGHFLFAEKKALSGNFDSHCTGSVCGFELETLRQAISDSKLVILPPFSLGEKGRLWILDPNEIAFEVATRLRAKKLIVLDTSPLPHFGEADPLEMTTDSVLQWLKNNPDLPQPQRLQLNSLTEACISGVERCHLLDGRVEGALLAELLTPKGAGVMITNSTYKHTRPARLIDLQSILEILNTPVQHAAVVLRSAAYIEQQIENYLVFCVDEDVVGCCEIINFLEGLTVEIASLAVDKSYRNQGIGSQLIQAATEKIRSGGGKLVFALSTASSHVFTQCGFREISPNELPDEKRRSYDFQESIIYARNLN
ncbi:MAG TPA: amino-acid N-acetyltransferase [Candidatus Lambdaproteobacteria bacterium]|nr:amino-acid N-acetyltransferase [SAR324 cluster bacterium]HHZ77810.1 amino-acid N-acetyltransferase [Candidatus Lambdaproteobacteria bacterium]HIB45234.1 amino-acid N-acetyltransferase [Candidatus Lambdaproteobacteria bacterium]HIO61372.1 amino-acid N-acetyltransferase [Deltaproteobacteria bacterium]